MSLLLDALKRAEQAKQGAGEPPAPPLEALNFTAPPAATSDAASAGPPPLITRDRLPDISQSLEILTDDIAPPPLLRTPKETHRSSALKEGPSAAQAQVRRVFEAKEKLGNPKTPFYAVLGVLGALALAGGGYVWYQMQPHSQPMTTAQSGKRVTSALPQTAVPVLQRTPDAHAPIEAIVPPLRSTAPTTVIKSRQDSAPVAPQSAAPRISSGANFTKSAVTGLSLNEKAYAAFERGDLPTARSQYEAALTQEPLNRDALLGLAALDARAGQYQRAEAGYLRVLELNPRDAHAQAAMLALHGQYDAGAESRLKTLLTQQPDAGFLHFAMGNLYAGQGRWNEAQQAYFKAYTTAPTSADFAFNLAVSLDHLRQGKPAADYYRKALSLHAEQPGSFNPLQAESRLRELAR